MSAPGLICGMFDLAPQEDDDDLRVPCNSSLYTTTTMTKLEIEEEQEEDLQFVVLQQSLVMPQQQFLAVSATASRTFSDVALYLDEARLSELTDKTATIISTSTSSSSSLLMNNAPGHFDTPLLSPAIVAAANASDLDSEWLNRSFHSEEFMKLLATPSISLDFDTSATTPTTTSNIDVLDVAPMSLETLLGLGEMELPCASSFPECLSPSSTTSSRSPSPAPVAAASESNNKKRRGRPVKEDAVFHAPAPKKQRVIATPSTPSTPKPHPLSRPLTDDPEELERYTKYRQSNNEAACKSRLRRKEREQESSNKVDILEAQNAELKKELASLRGECGQLKSLLETFLASQKK